MTPFEKLVALCPVFHIVNKLSLSQVLYLKDNDSMMVMPNATIKVSSGKLINLPDPATYRLDKPTVEQMIEAGIMEILQEVSIPGDSEEASKPSGKNK